MNLAFLVLVCFLALTQSSHGYVARSNKVGVTKKTVHGPRKFVELAVLTKNLESVVAQAAAVTPVAVKGGIQELIAKSLGYVSQHYNKKRTQ